MNNSNEILRVESKDYTIREFTTLILDHDLDIKPIFQREYKMDRDTEVVSRLIESVILGIPIPSVYLWKKQDNTMDMIDGQQRIKTLTDFIKAEEHSLLKLKGLEFKTEYEGMSFKDLPKEIQAKIRNTTIRTVVIGSDSGNDDLKFSIFVRLNRGSTKLTPQELRRAWYNGSLSSFITNLAEENERGLAIEMLGLSKSKLADMAFEEIVARYFALRNTTFKETSLSKRINSFYRDSRNLGTNELEELGREFTETWQLISEVLGPCAFSIPESNWDESYPDAYAEMESAETSKSSLPVYDGLMFVFSKYLKKKYDVRKNKDKIRFLLSKYIPEKRDSPDWPFYGHTNNKIKVLAQREVIRKALIEAVGESEYVSSRNFPNRDELVETLLKKDNICSWCNQRIEKIDDAELDHKIAIANSGKSTAENAQVLHRYCNRQKSNK